VTCTSCLRRADWDVFASTAEESTLDGVESIIKGHIMNAILTDCFHIRSDWKMEPDEKPVEQAVKNSYNSGHGKDHNATTETLGPNLCPIQKVALVSY